MRCIKCFLDKNQGIFQTNPQKECLCAVCKCCELHCICSPESEWAE